jgi:hypothetical protein
MTCISNIRWCFPLFCVQWVVIDIGGIVDHYCFNFLFIILYFFFPSRPLSKCLSLFINVHFISINENNWFAESIFFFKCIAGIYMNMHTLHPFIPRYTRKTLCDKVCQWLATGLWFSLGTPISATKVVSEIFFESGVKHLTSNREVVSFSVHSLMTWYVYNSSQNCVGNHIVVVLLVLVKIWHIMTQRCFMLYTTYTHFWTMIGG